MDWHCENIINGDLSVNKVYESDNIVAFHHTRPFWEHHIVAIPKAPKIAGWTTTH